MTWGVSVCLGVSLGCLEGVLGVIKTYRLTKSKMAVEVIWRVHVECLGGCLEGVWGCLEGVWQCLEGVWRVYWGNLNTYGLTIPKI